MSELLKCVEIEPAGDATATVIWLHGLGASGHDFEPIVPELQLPAGLPVRFVFPHAPDIPVTVNGGMVMPAWYDILAMDIDRKVDEAGVLASADAVDALIEREIQRGIPAHRIVIAGFSQGGAVAYQAALRYPQKLAGLLTLSTYMAMPVTPSAANASLPVMICHRSEERRRHLDHYGLRAGIPDLSHGAHGLPGTDPRYRAVAEPRTLRLIFPFCWSLACKASLGWLCEKG